MYPPLKFTNDIIRPWENLNKILINQNSIDHSISELITNANDIAIRLSHFPELLGNTSLRTNRTSIYYNVIVDMADASKHDKISSSIRIKDLSISSIFEGNNDGMFRFIRNKITVDHIKYGKYDFMDLTKKAVNFVLNKLQLPLFWDPDILEAPMIFTDKVFLTIHYQHQIAWQGLKIEFVKRNEQNEFIHFDPPKWLFELRSYHGLNASTYKEYIYQLLNNSIDTKTKLSSDLPIPIIDSFETYLSDFTLDKSIATNRDLTIIKIIDEQCTIDLIEMFKQLLINTNAQSIILISKNEFLPDVKEYIVTKSKNIFLITVEINQALNIPLRFFNIKYNYSNMGMKSLSKPTIGVLEADQHLFETYKNIPLLELGAIFSIDKVSLLNFQSLCLTFVKPKENQTTGHAKLSFKPNGLQEIYCKINDDFIKIGIEAEFDWITEIVELRMPILTFDKAQTGVSIWKIETFIEFENKFSPLSFRVLKYGNTEAVGMV